MGAIGAQTVDTADRLAALRKLMVDHNIDTYVVPSEDQRERLGLVRLRINTDAFIVADSSEYPAECDKRRAFISGFNGSAGSSLC
jgi:Xaa-Pro aminopeptidase